MIYSRFRFPEYEIISDNKISLSAGVRGRYSDNSLRGIIMDIHFLSLTDYLVCTFSSQVCMQHNKLHEISHKLLFLVEHKMDGCFI